MKKLAALLALVIMTAFMVAARESAETAEMVVCALDDEVVGETADSMRHVSSTLWMRQLIDNRFHINDPEVAYPRFPRFLLKVYNWGDKTFNSYDSDYVVGSGKNWKVLGKSYNWFQNYNFFFPHNENINIRSNINADVGAYIHFMALSIGYMINANDIIGSPGTSRTNFDFGFTCALFTIDYASIHSDGGAKITSFGDYDLTGGSYKFSGIENSQRTFTALYFGNHRKYSHAAAYCFSKYQLKSAGSWLVGFNYLKQDIRMDFTGLPEEMREAIVDFEPRYRFNYSDYAAIGGYGYNWVLKPTKWLINASPAVGIGYKKMKEDSTDGRRDMAAVQALFNGAVVYNHRALFASLNTQVHGSLYYSDKYSFFNANLSLQLTVGARF